MLTIVDKVLCLQNVDIFNHTTTETWPTSDRLAQELQLPEGTTIFKQH